MSVKVTILTFKRYAFPKLPTPFGIHFSPPVTVLAQKVTIYLWHTFTPGFRCKCVPKIDCNYFVTERSSSSSSVASTTRSVYCVALNVSCWQNSCMFWTTQSVWWTPTMQSPEWTILSHVSCFIHGELVGLQVFIRVLVVSSSSPKRRC